MFSTYMLVQFKQPINPDIKSMRFTESKRNTTAHGSDIHDICNITTIFYMCNNHATQ